MSELYFVTLPILLLIITGALARSFFIKDESFWMYCNKLAYYILLPALIIQGTAKADFASLPFSKLTIVAFLATCIVAAMAFLCKPLFKIDGSAFSSIFQGATRYNSYILISVLASIMPTDGIVYFSILTVFMMILTNVLSVIVLTIYSKNQKISFLHILQENIKNPLIIAIFIGLIFCLLGIQFPRTVNDYFNYLGHAAITISLLSVGAGLNLKASYQHVKFTGLATFMKLIMLPGICIALLDLFAVTGPSRLAAVAYAAVPCAGNAYILAKQMNADAELMATIITATTFFGIMTIPFFIMLAG